MKRSYRLATLGVCAIGLSAGLLTPGVASARPTDPVTGCWEEYDSGVVGSSPISFGMLQNDIPRGITISKWLPAAKAAKYRTDTKARVKVGADSYSLVTPEAPEVWLGQRTPYMDGGTVTDAKQILSGSSFKTDHWWGSMDNVGCQTNIMYAIGQGKSDVASAIGYNGRPVREGVEKWWGIPKEYSYEGPKGYVKFTCRGTPGASDSGYFWNKVNSGAGFTGSDASKGVDPQAGKAPACQDEVFKDSRVRHFWDMTYYGNTEPRTARGCTTSSSNSTLGCYQLMYQGPWKRSIRFETHVWAPAMKTRISSTATIVIPAKYSTETPKRSVTRRLSWRITDANISGSWPSGYRQSRFTKPSKPSDFELPSPYTIPGGGQSFLLSGWGSIADARQVMEYRLTADTDGTWNWPVDPVTGEEMERPSGTVKVGYQLGNFDDNSGSCTSGEYWNDLKPSRNDACIQGFVPTVWAVPTDQGQRERRVFPTGKDANGKDVTSSAYFTWTPIPGQNWMDSQLKVQNVTTDAPQTVSANVTWTIRLAGEIDSVA